jgi:flagellar assembly protein FliH
MSSSREGAVLRGEAAANAVAPWSGAEDRRLGERRAWGRRATDAVPGSEGTGRPGMLLGDVYAAELAQLKEVAHEEGYQAGYQEGMQAAEAAVAEVEREAAERLAEVQARWERRLASAVAAMGAASRQLEEHAAPPATASRESIIGAVRTLVEDLLGHELVLAESPTWDAVRRALTLCPSDAPVVVRVHPDDLAEIEAESLADLPDTVRVIGDPSVERAGALAESGTRRVDAQLMAALERVQAVLGT